MITVIIPCYNEGGNLLKLIDVPDSLSSYGLDDTFVEEGCRMMKQKGYDVKQYTLDNMLVCENRKYRDLNPYVNYITDKTNSDEFKQGYRDNAKKMDNQFIFKTS